ncbi:hypothetical protein Goshw_018477, partial [Gossypium schwendimanii]|nr:hypothetical protein [Gossypium schwendimanii]
MSEDTQSREGDCQIASFDSSLPQIICMDCKRNCEDKLKRIWQSWDKAKKMHIWDKDLLRIYWKRNVDFRGPLASLMRVPVDKMKARLKDKMVLAFPGPTLGMLWERPAVIDIWHCLHLQYTG